MRVKKICRRILMGLMLYVMAAAVHTGRTDDMVVEAATQYYTVSGTTLNLSSSAPPETSIGQAMQYVRKNQKDGIVYTIKLPAGEYDLGSGIGLSPGVKLDLTGVTLKYQKKSGNMIYLSQMDNSGNASTKYGGKGSICVSGGTFIGNNANTSSLIRMAHGTDITFDGCTLAGGGCAHQMEIAAVNGFTVKNSAGFGIGLYDGCAVSSEISGNKIEGCKSHGISISLKCYEKKISGNTIKKIDTYPIVINTSSKKTITITGNKITTKSGQDKIRIINGVVKK